MDEMENETVLGCIALHLLPDTLRFYLLGVIALAFHRQFLIRNLKVEWIEGRYGVATANPFLSPAADGPEGGLQCEPQGRILRAVQTGTSYRCIRIACEVLVLTTCNTG